MYYYIQRERDNYTCVYIYVYVCIYVYIYICIHIFIYFIKVAPFDSLPPGLPAAEVVARAYHLSIALSLSLSLYIHIYIYIHTHIHVYTYTYTYVCIYIYIYIYIDTYIRRTQVVARAYHMQYNRVLEWYIIVIVAIGYQNGMQ